VLLETNFIKKPYQRHVLAVLVLYALGLLVYADTFTTPFVFDDIPNIRDNTSIALRTLSLDGLYRAAFESVSPRRAVAFVSFALNYWVHGFDVRGYHLVNLLVHISNAVMVYCLVLLLLTRDSRAASAASRAHVRLAALVAAALFVVHPIQIQAVTYIVQRMTSLSTFFILLSLLCFVTARLGLSRYPVALWLGCLVSGLLAIATKEIAAILPFAILLVEWCFFQQSRWRWLAENARYVVIAFISFAVVALLYLGVEPLTTISDRYLTREFSLVERLLTELRVVFFYLGLILYPTPERFNLLHEFSISRSFLEPVTTLISALGLLAMIAVAMKCVGRRPVVVFCVLWCLLTSLIESSVVGLELVYEHRVYLPMFGLCVGVGAVVRWFAARTPGVWVGAVGVLLYLSASTYTRNTDWADATTLWGDVVLKSPGSARSHNNFGRALLETGERERALLAFNNALFLNPDYAQAHNNLGVLFATERQFGVAIDYLQRSLELRPHSAHTLHNLGLTLIEIGRVADAIEQLREAVRLEPNYAKAHLALAKLIAKTGDDERACEHVRAAARTAAAAKVREALAYCER